jgi:hypothetical protein
MGTYHSQTPEGLRLLNQKFRSIVLDAFTPDEISALAHIAAAGMLPVDEPPARP